MTNSHCTNQVRSRVIPSKSDLPRVFQKHNWAKLGTNNLVNQKSNEKLVVISNRLQYLPQCSNPKMPTPRPSVQELMPRV
ncbi:hypothetical protein I7I48_07912 [Histoplasma ohiense]|nr:hypothetical protein I7I48_07912 [Histoplasma ohiense (nom. inval.)]